MDFLTQDQKSFLFKNLGGVGIIITLIKVGLITNKYLRMESVPIWYPESESAGWTLIGSSFFTPIVAGLIITLVTRSLVRKGKMPPIESADSLPKFIRFFKRPLWARLPLIGLLFLIVFGGLTGLVFAIADFQPFAGKTFFVINLLFLTVLVVGGLIFCGILALTDIKPEDIKQPEVVEA